MTHFSKRTVFAALAAGTAIMLSGCNVKIPFTEKKPNFDRTYTVCAEINCDRLKAKADVTRAGAQDWEFVFTEPKQLQGMKLCYGTSGLSASLGDLSFGADENSEYAMLPEIIADTIDTLSGIPAESLIKEEGTIVAESAYDGEKVTVSVDEKTGNLLSLKCPYYQLAVTFSDQKPYVSNLPDDSGLITSSTPEN